MNEFMAMQSSPATAATSQKMQDSCSSCSLPRTHSDSALSKDSSVSDFSMLSFKEAKED
jgi:hypothetical protein